jgi:hypothetical protein
MTKTSSLTLVAVAFASALTLAVPAIADDDAGTSFNDDLVKQSLAERGFDVIDLAEAPGKIRATVRLADGSTTFQYFDINSLQPLDAAGSSGNSRVLTELDVGNRASVNGLNSLTWEDPPGND